jgi:hypothetical protein
MTQSPERKEKEDLAHYAAMVTAWFNTRLEHDKSLLTLSSAGIGLLIALVQKVEINFKFGVVVYAMALLSFVLCLITVLLIYRRNSRHLEDIVAGKTSSSRLLSIADGVALYSFMLGVICAAGFGFGIAIHGSNLQERPMAKEDEGASNRQMAMDSFNKAVNMRPAASADPFNRSFADAGKMKTTEAPAPKATAPAGTSPQAAVPATPAAASGTTDSKKP